MYICRFLLEHVPTCMLDVGCCICSGAIQSGKVVAFADGFMTGPFVAYYLCR